ncbi:MAG: hypothetical protein WA324_27765 [Bryobacteraceae bacterium]
MSDFTKEELEIILEGILWRDNHVHPNERPEKLKCKIQSMIENYCEHPESYRYTYDNEIAYCDKCKTMWKEI